MLDDSLSHYVVAPIETIDHSLHKVEHLFKGSRLLLFVEICHASLDDDVDLF